MNILTEHNKLITAGTILKTHGLKGMVTAAVKFEIPEDIDVLFVEISKKPVPFFVEAFSQTGMQTAIIKLEWVDDPKSASVLQNHHILLTRDQIKKNNQITDQGSLHDLVSFSVKDREKGLLGVIDHVIEIPKNPLIAVKGELKEILIPFSEELIKKIDNEHKIITVTLPEGLTDL